MTTNNINKDKKYINFLLLPFLSSHQQPSIRTKHTRKIISTAKLHNLLLEHNHSSCITVDIFHAICTQSHTNTIFLNQIIYLLREKYIFGKKYVRFRYETTLIVTLPLEIASVTVAVMSISRYI